MPFIFAVEVKYAQAKYLLDDLGNLMSDYPFLEGKVITGKILYDSESLAEKVKGFTGSLYSFASVGGPHSGVVTREETELILKCTMSLLFYVNFLLKNQCVMTPERT